MSETAEIAVDNPLNEKRLLVKVDMGTWRGFVDAMVQNKQSVALFFEEVVDPIIEACVEDRDTSLAED